MAGDPFDKEKILKGELTPMFFGSAMTNSEFSLFLRSFYSWHPNPA